MASVLTTTTTPSRGNEREAIDLARLDDDDDGGGRRRSEVPATLTLRVELVPLAPADPFSTADDSWRTRAWHAGEVRRTTPHRVQLALHDGCCDDCGASERGRRSAKSAPPSA